MTLSLNEFETLCTRAARGAGLPWGLAEEAGKAARCLAEFGLPGAQLLVRILTHFDGKPLSERGCEALDGPWRREGGPMCPLIVGAALMGTAAVAWGAFCDKIDTGLGRQINTGSDATPTMVGKPCDFRAVKTSSASGE